MDYREIYLLILLLSFGSFTYLFINGFQSNIPILSFWITSVVFIIINETTDTQIRFQNKSRREK